MTLLLEVMALFQVIFNFIPTRISQAQDHLSENVPNHIVAPGFKDKTKYTLYVSPGIQISHIATKKGNIIRQYLLHNILV